MENNEKATAPAAEKGTYLILHLGDKKELFLEAVDSEAAGTYFKAGPNKAFLSTTKEGVFTGAVNLSLGVPGEKEGEYNNVESGVLFRKQGANGPFLSGYVGGVKIVPGEKEGTEFVNITPVATDADGKKIGVVNITADIRGPKAERILEALPVVENRKAADKTADAEPARRPKP